MLLWHSLCVLAFVCSGLFAEDLWKVTYRYNDRTRIADRVSKKKLEESFGAKVLVINVDEPPPAEPMVVDGTVLHNYYGGKDGDNKWIVSRDRNEPGKDHVKRQKKLVEMAGISDLDEKWSEYTFLKKFAPGIGAPETRLVSSFEGEKLSPAEQAEIRSAVDGAMKEFKKNDPALRKKLIELEKLRRDIDKSMGKSILKARYGAGSEGALPRTNQNWAELYLEGMSEKSNEVTVMNEMLKDPGNVISQKMIPIEKEVRVHIVNGQVLDDAMFLRFYHINEYLTADERTRVKKEVEDKFLIPLRAQVGEELSKVNATPDVAILEDGTMSIIDYNAGIESGYYKPYEDIFTTNYLSKTLTGKNTPFLEEWERFKSMPMGAQKVEWLKNFFKKWDKFISPYDVQEAYWDRIITHYKSVIAENPTPKRFAQALGEFEKAGLDSGTIFLQFMNDVQETVKDSSGKPLTLSPTAQAYWNKKLEKLDTDIKVTVENGKITGSWREDEPCPLGKIAQAMK